MQDSYIPLPLTLELGRHDWDGMGEVTRLHCMHRRRFDKYISHAWAEYGVIVTDGFEDEIEDERASTYLCFVR